MVEKMGIYESKTIFLIKKFYTFENGQKIVILDKKLYSTMLCGLLGGFDTILTKIKKKRERITSANRLSDQNFQVKSSTPSFADQKSV